MSQSEWKVHFFSGARFVKIFTMHQVKDKALLVLTLTGFCTCTHFDSKNLQVLSLIILRLWWSLNLLHNSEVLTSKTRSLCSSQGHTFAHSLFWIDFSAVYKMRLEY